MGIRVVGLADHHHTRFVPAARRHVGGFHPVHILSQILLTAEHHFDIFVQTSAAIETGVYHNTLLVDILAERLSVKLAEAAVVHRLDMHISQTSVRPALHISLALTHPAVIHQSVLRALRYRQYDLLEVRAVGSMKTHQSLLACQVGKQHRRIGVSRECLAVDRLDDIAGFHT